MNRSSLVKSVCVAIALLVSARRRPAPSIQGSNPPASLCDGLISKRISLIAA